MAEYIERAVVLDDVGMTHALEYFAFGFQPFIVIGVVGELKHFKVFRVVTLYVHQKRDCGGTVAQVFFNSNAALEVIALACGDGIAGDDVVGAVNIFFD